ncbi:MAG: helix-turn-helix domain-containing protein [Firmicutes bacterium]|nr:helix-turn-helix domain-containing protein [Bacillota bacterium]
MKEGVKVTEVGRMLEEARLRKGITLDKVEQDLKIRKHYLIAMEAGRWEDLPGSVYAIGFLRNYGDYLGLSGEDLVEEYKYWREVQGTDDLVEEPPIGVFTRSKELQTDSGIFQLSAKGAGKKRRRRKFFKGMFVIIVLLAALGAYLYLTWQQPFSHGPIQSLEDTESGYPGDVGLESVHAPDVDSRPEVDGISSDVPEFDDDRLAEEVDSSRQGQASSKSQESQNVGPAMLDSESAEPEDNPSMQRSWGDLAIGEDIPLPTQSLDTTSDGEMDEDDSVDETPSPLIVVPSDTVHRIPPMELEEDVLLPMILEVYATGKCWVEVHADDKLQFSRTIEAGERHAWTGFEEIRARFGNAGAVELRFNGQELGPAGKGVVTRVFTPES